LHYQLIFKLANAYFTGHATLSIFLALMISPFMWCLL